MVLCLRVQLVVQALIRIVAVAAAVVVIVMVVVTVVVHRSRRCA